MQLAGKNILITGAAKRIGREIALTLAREGARILLHYHDSHSEALQVKKEIEKTGAEAVLLAADFSAGRGLVSGVQTFVRSIERAVKRIDVLINNASIFYSVPFGKISEKNWDDFLTVNLKAPFFLSQEIGKKMLKQKSGTIINLLDWTVERPSPDYLPYVISKAGLLAATKGLAKALAPHVQVNGIAPGPILAPEGSSKKHKHSVAEKTLLKRFGSPKDIAQTVKFLVTGTDYVTGAVIPVEGGSLLA